MIINIKNTNIKIWNKLTFLHITSSHCYYGNIQVFMSTTWLWEYPHLLSCLVILILTCSLPRYDNIQTDFSIWSCSGWLPDYENMKADYLIKKMFRLTTWLRKCSGWLPDYENVQADYLIMKMFKLTTWLRKFSGLPADDDNIKTQTWLRHYSPWLIMIIFTLTTWLQ